MSNDAITENMVKSFFSDKSYLSDETIIVEEKSSKKKTRSKSLADAELTAKYESGEIDLGNALAWAL